MKQALDKMQLMTETTDLFCSVYDYYSLALSCQRTCYECLMANRCLYYSAYRSCSPHSLQMLELCSQRLLSSPQYCRTHCYRDHPAGRKQFEVVESTTGQLSWSWPKICPNCFCYSCTCTLIGGLYRSMCGHIASITCTLACMQWGCWYVTLAYFCSCCFLCLLTLLSTSGSRKCTFFGILAHLLARFPSRTQHYHE